MVLLPLQTGVDDLKRVWDVASAVEYDRREPG